MVRRRRTLLGIAMGALPIVWVIACSTSDPNPAVEPPASSAPEAAATETDTADNRSIRDSSQGDAIESIDAVIDVDVARVVQKRVSGHVDYNGPVANAAVTVLAPALQSTATDDQGDFFLYAPLGSAVIVKVVAPGAIPMIRGVTVGETNRIRIFYLAGDSERTAASDLGDSFDPAKGIVEVDFRDSAIGGYGATLKTGSTATTPGFGIAFDQDGMPKSSLVTVVGGDGSTMLYGDVAAGTVSFAPIVPVDAGLPCQPCDAAALPVQAGVVTWFDFECGMATDCQ